MKCYAIAEVNITDSGWITEYLEKVTPIVEKYAGKYLARTGDIEIIEGDKGPAHSIVIIEFPTKAAALEFYDSEQYQPFKKSRQAGSTGSFQLVAGEDIAKVGSKT